MAFDSAAREVVIKALGTVESSLNYHAVNYNDPITVGVMQWYGTRAAAILGRIRTADPTGFAAVAPSLIASLDAHAATEAWWNDRWLTNVEGDSLRQVLENNKDVQNAQAAEDLDAYVETAKSLHIDVDGNTQMMMLFFVALHQSPARAKRLINAIGPDSGLDRLLSSLLNEPIFGRYRSRYNTAYTIIKNMDSSGVDLPPETVDPDDTPTDPDSSAGSTRAAGPIKYVRIVGDAIHVHLEGRTVICSAVGAGTYRPAQDSGTGAPVVPPVTTPPATPPPADGDARRALVVKWMTDRIGRFVYGQVPGRLDPDNSGVTDCSGSVRTAYRTQVGIDPGNSSRDQVLTGVRIYKGQGPLPESSMLPGDLIFYSKTSAEAKVYHVAMYMGGGQRVHTGKVHGMNPNIDNIPQGPAGGWLWVNRYI